jgi:lysophospholipase L1-like esterase
MRIAFLGDSLTEGHPGESYLARLRRLLPGDELRNGGRAGDTIPALLARFEHTGLEPADLAFVWIGVNDAFLGDWYLPDLDELLPPDDGPPVGGPADPSATGHRLRPVYDRILDLVVAQTPLVVCVPPVLPDPFDAEGIAERVADLAAMIAAAVARRSGRARLFDLGPAFAARQRVDDHFTIDGVHLSARGADVVATTFRDLIAELREERARRTGQGPR